MNGIGYSSTGYNGPYTTAWTIDGAFNADFITSGTINSNLIAADSITTDHIDMNSLQTNLAYVGDRNGYHLELTGEKIGFYDGRQEVAYISGQRLYINQSVVLDEMQLGSNKWSWKYNNNDDSMYLKWIG